MIPGRLYRFKGDEWVPLGSPLGKIGNVSPGDILIHIETKRTASNTYVKVICQDVIGWIIFEREMEESDWFEEAVSD